MAENLRTPRGTKDILPEEQRTWLFLADVVQKKCESFGCGRIETPIFEYGEIFTKSLGQTSDIVTKEMYQVSRASTQLEPDDEKRILVLRPEFTAGIVRSYLEHGMKTWPQPVKLYYWGPIFRYDRPQAGRFRQSHQFGVEIIGDADPLTDAFVIYLGYQIFKKIGLEKNLIVDINSIGCSLCRPKMKKRLTEYFEKFLSTLCADCNRRFVENPLRILDCKEEKCQRVLRGAPQVVDMLCETCKNNFKQILENLDNLQIPYNLNPRLVRGLDYYTRTVFEFLDKGDTSRQSALLGGGRYDNLIKIFGGPDTPAIGFAAGIERIVTKMKEAGIEIPEIKTADVCLVQIGDKARKKALSLLSDLEEAGIDVACILGKESLKGQLRMASRLKAKICLIMGQREALDQSVIVRDMEDGSQETIKLKKLIDVLKDRLK